MPREKASIADESGMYRRKMPTVPNTVMDAMSIRYDLVRSFFMIFPSRNVRTIFLLIIRTGLLFQTFFP